MQGKDENALFCFNNTKLDFFLIKRAMEWSNSRHFLPQREQSGENKRNVTHTSAEQPDSLPLCVRFMHWQVCGCLCAANQKTKVTNIS